MTEVQGLSGRLGTPIEGEDIDDGERRTVTISLRKLDRLITNSLPIQFPLSCAFPNPSTNRVQLNRIKVKERTTET
jgi:hypothetical protein